MGTLLLEHKSHYLATRLALSHHFKPLLSNGLSHLEGLLRKKRTTMDNDNSQFTSRLRLYKDTITSTVVSCDITHDTCACLHAYTRASVCVCVYCISALSCCVCVSVHTLAHMNREGRMLLGFNNHTLKHARTKHSPLSIVVTSFSRGTLLTDVPSVDHTLIL